MFSKPAALGPHQQDIGGRLIEELNPALDQATALVRGEARVEEGQKFLELSRKVLLSAGAMTLRDRYSGAQGLASASGH